MKALKIAVGVALLGLALTGCANDRGLYSGGSYYNSFGRGYTAEYQPGNTFHYHDSYFPDDHAPNN